MIRSSIQKTTQNIKYYTSLAKKEELYLKHLIYFKNKYGDTIQVCSDKVFNVPNTIKFVKMATFVDVEERYYSYQIGFTETIDRKKYIFKIGCDKYIASLRSQWDGSLFLEKFYDVSLMHTKYLNKELYSKIEKLQKKAFVNYYKVGSNIVVPKKLEKYIAIL